VCKLAAQWRKTCQALRAAMVGMASSCLGECGVAPHTHRVWSRTQGFGRYAEADPIFSNTCTSSAALHPAVLSIFTGQSKLFGEDLLV
jgi:hypothetical protein